MFSRPGLVVCAAVVVLAGCGESPPGADVDYKALSDSVGRKVAEDQQEIASRLPSYGIPSARVEVRPYEDGGAHCVHADDGSRWSCTVHVGLYSPTQPGGVGGYWIEYEVTMSSDTCWDAKAKQTGSERPGSVGRWVKPGRFRDLSGCI